MPLYVIHFTKQKRHLSFEVQNMNEEKNLRRLVIKAFHINNVIFAEETKIGKDTLLINKEDIKPFIKKEELVKNITISIIKPGDYDREINTIMDIIPISTKVLGILGEGITHTLTGTYVMLTGATEDGQQMAEFGSSEGNLREQLYLDRAGTPSKKDTIIHIDVELVGGHIYDRNLPNACFRTCDAILQIIREELKKLTGQDATETHEFFDKVRPDKPKVVIIKQIAGQGAMYDNQLFSKEPSGIEGGRSIIDMANIPMIISPNEYRDGALRSMT